MKKMIGMIALLLLMMGVVGCNRETVNINFPFEVGQVENIEMYHYTGVPVSAEKKKECCIVYWQHGWQLWLAAEIL